jgi:cbb3-type cytochrome oxidase maturation protein
MSVILIMIPVTFIIAAIAVVAFVKSARRGQFDDLESPAHRMLHDDERE